MAILTESPLFKQSKVFPPIRISLSEELENCSVIISYNFLVVFMKGNCVLEGNCVVDFRVGATLR